jgi:hypothetical protein
MVNRRELIKVLGSPNNRTKFVKGWQNVNDIIEQILEQHNENLIEAIKIKKYFCSNTETETAKKIYVFLRNEIIYKIEPSDKQTTKSLKRFLQDGYGDCKHFSIFTNTILNVCGYSPKYRFTGYNGGGLQHVYSVGQTGVIIDGVLPYFDTENNYTTKKDIKINKLNMALYKLSGVENNELNGLSFNKLKKGFKNVTSSVSNAAKKIVAEIPQAAKKVVQGTKTVTLAIPRTAFIGLILLNVRGWATALKKILDRKGEFEAFKWWFELGGNRTELKNAVNKGANRKAFLAGIEEEEASRTAIFDGYSGDGVYIGVEPVSVTTALASAAPIIAKLLSFLKENNIDLETLEKTTQTIKEANAGFKTLTGSSVQDIIFKKDEGQTSNTAKLSLQDLKPTTMANALTIAKNAAAQTLKVPVSTIEEQTPVAWENVLQPANVTANKLPKNALLIGGGAALFLLFLANKN